MTVGFGRFRKLRLIDIQRSALLLVLALAAFLDGTVAQVPVISAGTVPSRPLSELEESNLVQCVGMIQRVIETGATQPGLNDVAAEIYRSTNPGPYPYAYTVEDDPRRILHPFLLGEPLSVTLASFDGQPTAALYEEGKKNASALASATCCDGATFGFALPFSQDTSNESGMVDLGDRLRYYVTTSGKANQTDITWYVACPYTSIPATARTNSNFPQSLSTSSYPRLALALFISIAAQSVLAMI